MKIRNGFVSNSSSSSFIVYKEGADTESVNYSKYSKYFKKKRYPYYRGALYYRLRWKMRSPYKEVSEYQVTLPLGKLKKLHSFGLEFIRRGTFEDKVNFLFLQLRELENFCRNSSGDSFNKDNMQKYCYKANTAFKKALEIILKKSKKISEKVILDTVIDYNAIEWDSIYRSRAIIGIDHQSLWHEAFWEDFHNKDCDTLFKVYYPWLLEPEKIVEFLIGDSYIQCGNDNSLEEGEGFEEWRESKKLEVESIKNRFSKEEKKNND